MGNGDRLERISGTFLQGERVWPKGYLSHPGHTMLKMAFLHVLLQLPEHVYGRVERELNFFFDASHPSAGGCLLMSPTVVIFERSLQRCSEVGLAGLIAHEIAHLICSETTTEADADEQAIYWGFGDEIRALRREGD